MTQDTVTNVRLEAPSGWRSLRTRLIATSIIVTALAIAAMGFYVYYRGQQDTNTLANLLDTSVRQQAQANLTATSNEQVAIINTFFTDMRRDIADAGASAGQVLSRQAALGTGTYWNAVDSLVRLPTGSWDNPSEIDAASVFIPAKNELSDSLAVQVNSLRYLDFVVPGKLQANPDAVAPRGRAPFQGVRDRDGRRAGLLR